MKTAPYMGLLLLCLFLSSACSKQAPILNLDPFENSEWLVLRQKNGDLNFDAPRTYVLTFLSDGAYRINMDLNNCSGTYSYAPEEGSITFKRPACTEICCDSNFAVGMLTLLYRDVNAYEFEGNELFLSKGERQLVLARR